MTCLRHFGSLIQLSLDTKERTISQSWSDLDVETSFALLGNMTAISIRFINLTVSYDKVGNCIEPYKFYTPQKPWVYRSSKYGGFTVY